MVALTLLAWVTFLAPAAADIIIVDSSGGGDYLTIQEGVNAAATGDTVLVAPGVYYEHVLLDDVDDAICLLSESGVGETIIDGLDVVGPPLLRIENVAPNVRVSGFTFRDGVASSETYGRFGGGIYVASSSVTIEGNVIESCRAGYEGGGIYATDSEVGVVRNLITGNRAGVGAGIGLYSCAALIEDNEIVGNTAYTFDEYWGGGIAAQGGTVTITGNRITDNDTLGNGGAIYLSDWYGPPLVCTVADNLIAGNVSVGSAGLYIHASEAAVTGNVITSNTCLYSGANRRSCISINGPGTSVSFEDNVIVDNEGSTFLFWDHTSSSINGNSFGRAEDFVALVEASCTADSIDMTGNWWGTADPDSIGVLIFDCTDTTAVSTCVTFGDWCTDPACAGTVTSVPEQREMTWSGIKAMFKE